MERSTWTNERLDDLAKSMREGFVRTDNDIRDVRGEIGALRAEMNDGFKQVRGEIAELRQTMFRMLIAMVLGYVSLLAAILANGV